MSSFKNALSYTALVCAIVVLISTAVILLEATVNNTWYCLVIIISCPFIAYSVFSGEWELPKKKAQNIICYILILNAWCSYSAINDNDWHEVNLKGLILKGTEKQEEVLIEYDEDENGKPIPAYYKTVYSFHPDPNQPKFLIIFIEWGLLLIAVGTPIVVYRILVKVNKE